MGKKPLKIRMLEFSVLHGQPTLPKNNISSKSIWVFTLLRIHSFDDNADIYADTYTWFAQCHSKYACSAVCHFVAH